MLATFLEAVRSSDLEALERLFAADVASVSDGNGAKHVARRVVAGAARVATFIVAFSTWCWEGVDVRWMTVNGRPAAVLRRGDVLLGMVVVDASADGIEQVLWRMNSDKLAAAVGK